MMPRETVYDHGAIVRPMKGILLRFTIAVLFAVSASSCGLPRHPPEFRQVRLDSTGTLFNDRIILFRKKFIEITLCAESSQEQRMDSATWNRYWLHPENNGWQVRTRLHRGDSVMVDFVSMPSSKRPEIRGDLLDPLVCRIVWSGDIPAGIHGLEVRMLDIDSTLGHFSGQLRIYKPYYMQ